MQKYGEGNGCVQYFQKPAQTNNRRYPRPLPFQSLQRRSFIRLTSARRAFSSDHTTRRARHPEQSEPARNFDGSLRGGRGRGWSILSLSVSLSLSRCSSVRQDTAGRVLTFQTSLLFATQEHVAGGGRFEIRPDLIGINKVTNVRVS